MPFNVPEVPEKRVVIVGAGFAGFTLVNKLRGSGYQVVLVDRNNYHQFQPLFYQVAMSGLEPSSICFPLRKNFRSDPRLFVRVAEVHSVDPLQKQIHSDIGILNYDILVIASGASTNYYGNRSFALHSIPLKSVSEALYLRNRILEDFERAVLVREESTQDLLMDVVIVGGGPTGVELAGSLAEMKRHIVPKDYPDLNAANMDVHLIQNTGRLLNGMSENSSRVALEYLKEMGVHVHLNAMVERIESDSVILNSGRVIPTRKVIWAAGVKAAPLPGLPEKAYNRDNRIIVDPYCRVAGTTDIFCIGDVSYFPSPKYPNGLPGLAPVAMQQARYLAKLLMRQMSNRKISPFNYLDKGQMATIGRSKAVLDFGRFHLSGFFAWMVWLFIHIYYLVGVRNRIVVFINWVWSYLFYDQALRLNIKPYSPEGHPNSSKKSND
ncbi:MAG: NAD(P)/FAD-dependent oxidoreductase [Saprospiraceae bacterium]|nr:NAD(P)/FAD-dependent oxidoreductase [Saprospiraceae bacterium]